VIIQLPWVSVRGSQDDDDLVSLHQPFGTALCGFNRRQVLEHLETLDGRIAMVAADRDAALAQVAELSKVLNHLRVESELLEHLRRETEQANSEVKRILAAPMGEVGARIQRIMRLAEEEAADLKATAEADIAARKARADQEIAELKASADEQITGLRACASREAKSLLGHARRQCDQLETESASRREAAEQEVTQANAERESAASARIQNSELRSIARLQFMQQVIGEHLATRADAVESGEAQLHEQRTRVASELTALKTLRTEVTTAVATAHQLLAEVLEQVRKTAVETTPEQTAPKQTRTVERPEPAVPPVPAQRSTEGGTVYLLKADAEGRQLPRPRN
jgi:hypothetical protein